MWTVDFLLIILFLKIILFIKEIDICRERFCTKHVHGMSKIQRKHTARFNRFNKLSLENFILNGSSPLQFFVSCFFWESSVAG